MVISKFIRNIDYEKRLALASFAIELLAVDRDYDNKGLSAFSELFAALDLEDETDIRNVLETDYANSLKDLDFAEAITIVATFVSIRWDDGSVSSIETPHLEATLNKSGINPDYIPQLIEGITKTRT
jgi:hypothetical protein